MKKNTLLVLAFMASTMIFTTSCSKDDNDNNDDDDDVVETLSGQPGNPRFNLQFTNEENVDLDLHVMTPAGNEIYYANASADGGELDVDCQCAGCSQGPNENIYWQDGTAPTGTYQYWVEYYGSCGSSGSSSYTLRVVKNNSVLVTKTGSLSEEGTSQVWTHNQQ